MEDLEKRIFQQAYDECMRELYAKAQPQGDYDALCEAVRSGEIPKETKIYERYYLSPEELEYIVNKYIDAYHLKEHWKSNVDVVLEYLTEGGLKDGYVKESDGEIRRSYEKVAPIQKQLEELLKDEEKAKTASDLVLKTIKECQNFYHFDRNEESFKAQIYLGASPTSNSQTAIDYWKAQGVDVEIKERCPLLLWDMDYYGDEFEEIMEEEYGSDWEQYWWNEYNEAQRKKKEEREANFKKYLLESQGEEAVKRYEEQSTKLKN